MQGEIADLELASGLGAGHPHQRGSAHDAKWCRDRGPSLFSLFSQLFPSCAFSGDFHNPQSVHERSSAHFWGTCLGGSGAAVQITRGSPGDHQITWGSPALTLILQSPPQPCTSHPSTSLPAFQGICHCFEKQTGHLGREGAAVLPPWAWSIRSSHTHTHTHRLPSPNKQLFNKVCKQYNYCYLFSRYKCLKCKCQLWDFCRVRVCCCWPFSLSRVFSLDYNLMNFSSSQGNKKIELM